MKIIRKFLDASGKETTPDKAVEVHEVTVDSSGKAVSDAVFKVKKK